MTVASPPFQSIEELDFELTLARNRGELAEGWYDPATLQKAKASAATTEAQPESRKRKRESPVYDEVRKQDEDSNEDEVGPAPMARSVHGYARGARPGAAIPNMQDLEMRRGKLLEEAETSFQIADEGLEAAREDSEAARDHLRHDRKLDRNLQKERLDELVPRAEAGTKDRMLEKKREKADANRAFASVKTEAGGVEEVPESDLLGDEDGGIEGFKKRKKEMERKKNERELRKEEILRARAEEREERVRAYREKEEKTMSGLVALAKARFG